MNIICLLVQDLFVYSGCPVSTKTCAGLGARRPTRPAHYVYIRSTAQRIGIGLSLGNIIGSTMQTMPTDDSPSAWVDTAGTLVT